MATAQPGQVAVNSTVPFGAQQLDQATWAYGAAQKLLNGIINQAIQLGSASLVGMPASWPYGPIQNEDILAGGKASAILESKVQNYVNSQAAQVDPDFNSWVGADFSSASPGGYTNAPLSVSEQVALANQALAEKKYMDSLIGGGYKPSTSGSQPSVKVSYGSSGGSSSGGSSGTNYSERLGYEAQSGALGLELQAKEQQLKLQYQQALQALQNDPNNPQIALAKQQLEEQIRQFNEQMAYQQTKDQASLGLDRAKITADYAANPGDAVAREYFLRQQGQQPLGTPVNIFTGEQGTQGQMTLSELMNQQAPLLRPYMQSQITGAPGPADEGGPATPPTEPPPTEDVPQFAMGTRPEITKDGWTKADKFITGDHPMGIPNPEMNQVRVRNGQAETKVTPISQMAQNRRMPMYATGTEDPWAWMYAAPEEPSYQVTPDQTYSQISNYTPAPSPYGAASSSQTPSSYTPDLSKSYAINPTSGTVAQQTAPVVINNDPYYGTPYAGMKSTDIVTNKNSAYYGQTVQSAAAAQANADRAPQIYQIGSTYDTPGLYGADGNPLSSVQAPTMAAAGILTGAQKDAGVTQSTNPTQAGYQSPIAPPSSASGLSQQIDTDYGDGQPGTTTVNSPPVSGTGAITSDSGGNSTPIMQGGVVKSADGAATYNLLPGDIPLPEGGFGRWDELRQTYVPVEPVYTPIKTEAEFRQLPPDVQQKILTGQKTGYALTDDGTGWLSMLTNSTYGQGNTVLSKEEFLALPPEQQKAYLEGTTGALAGSYQPESTRSYAQSGQAMGYPTGGLTLGGAQQFPSYHDYAQYLTPEQLNALYDPGPATPPQTPEYLKNLIDTVYPWGNEPTMPDGWQYFKNPFTISGGQSADYDPSGRVKGNLISHPTVEGWTEPGQYIIGPDGTTYYSEQGGAWGRVDPVTDTSRLVNGLDGTQPFNVAQPTDPNNPNTPAPPPATGGTQPANPAGTDGIPSGNTNTTGGGETTGGGTTGGGTTGGTTGGNGNANPSLSDLFGLSYGGDVYQNLPILQLLQGLITPAEYDTISGGPIDVPGLPVSLPGANQAANYATLSNLQQQNPDAFALLNSLYTAGNVPLSAIMAFAKSRAPLGSAYEAGLVSTT